MTTISTIAQLQSELRSRGWRFETLLSDAKTGTISIMLKPISDLSFSTSEIVINRSLHWDFAISETEMTQGWIFFEKGRSPVDWRSPQATPLYTAGVQLAEILDSLDEDFACYLPDKTY